MICRACGAAHTSTLPGSGWIELVLWLFLLWPIALIYSIWRRTSKRRCGACGSTDLVGLETPVGRQLARTHHPDGVPAAVPPATAGALRFALIVCAPIVLLGAAMLLFR